MLGNPYYNQFTFFKYPDSIEPPDFFLKDSFISLGTGYGFSMLLKFHWQGICKKKDVMKQRVLVFCYMCTI